MTHLKFMILAAPRSGSTWAANWLCTERTLCLHDALLTMTEDELDRMPCDRMLGVSDTALALLPNWVNAHSARKVILHRARSEIDRSLEQIGLSPLSAHWDKALNRLQGRHYDWAQLFDEEGAQSIYEYLTELPFDRERHAQLVQHYIGPQFDRVHVKADCAQAFRRKVQAALSA